MCGALTRSDEERDVVVTCSGSLELCPSLMQPVIDTFGNDDLGWRHGGVGRAGWDGLAVTSGDRNVGRLLKSHVDEWCDWIWVRVASLMIFHGATPGG